MSNLPDFSTNPLTDFAKPEIKTSIHERQAEKKTYPCTRDPLGKCDFSSEFKNALANHEKTHFLKTVYTDDVIRISVPLGTIPQWDEELKIYVYPESWNIPQGYEILEYLPDHVRVRPYPTKGGGHNMEFGEVLLKKKEKNK